MSGRTFQRGQDTPCRGDRKQSIHVLPGAHVQVKPSSRLELIADQNISCSEKGITRCSQGC